MTNEEILQKRYGAQSILHKAEIRTFINKIYELQCKIKQLETEKEALISMVVEERTKGSI